MCLHIYVLWRQYNNEALWKFYINIREWNGAFMWCFAAVWKVQHVENGSVNVWSHLSITVTRVVLPALFSEQCWQECILFQCQLLTIWHSLVTCGIWWIEIFQIRNSLTHCPLLNLSFIFIHSNISVSSLCVFYVVFFNILIEI